MVFFCGPENTVMEYIHRCGEPQRCEWFSRFMLVVLTDYYGNIGDGIYCN